MTTTATQSPAAAIAAGVTDLTGGEVVALQQTEVEDDSRSAWIVLWEREHDLHPFVTHRAFLMRDGRVTIEAGAYLATRADGLASLRERAG